MPVQINEVIIRAVVDNGSTTAPAATSGIATSQATPDAEIAALVLEIIKEKNER
jgi:Family of unknown function (DUF5908)